jgi:FtsP/CotA-like multicopper oxidase with cupredoxin domain
MSIVDHAAWTRRGFLAGMGTAVFLAGLPIGAGPAAATRDFRLRAGVSRIRLLPRPGAETEVWSYNGSVPGPALRVRQGERVRVAVENGLAEDTTIHWHGLRLPNRMDGVPHLTQRPIAPGETFVYEFDAVDAGTFWYHPHQRSFEQVGRGLYGPLIVEERHPPAVDRDLTWVLDDWRLLPSARISDDFGNFHDVSHNGRVGNIATINGRIPDTFAVRAGERLRLRLVNAANARIFGLEFAEHRPWIIAFDGQPVEPHEPDGGRIILGPAMRVDVIVDMTGLPGRRFTVTDSFYRGLGYRLVDLVYDDTALRSQPPDGPITLPPNPLTEPDIGSAQRHEIVFGGGMMGMMPGARVQGEWHDIRTMARRGLVWAINGVAATGHAPDPLAVLRRGSSHVLAMANDTAWHHPIHLHGHSFRVLGRNGVPTRRREWQDTVLMNPRERIDIAFVADNPGDWMFHCHVLEHQAAGMMGVIRVA